MPGASWTAARRVTDAVHNLPRPGWVRWVAQDSDGCWWGYSVEPLRNDTGWYENELGRYARLGVGPAPGWEHSLHAVASGEPDPAPLRC